MRVLTAAGLILALALPALAQQAPPLAAIGEGRVVIAGLSVDVDTRPDLPGGPHYTLAAVKDFPSGIATILPVPAERLAGYLVQGRLVGPGLGSGSLRLRAAAGARFEVPALGAPGDYYLDDIHLLDPRGERIIDRDPSLPRVTIHAIDKIIVSEVTTRQLTRDEIRDRGIVIDSSSFAIYNFSLTLELGSKPVNIQVPVVQPLTPGLKIPELPHLPQPTATFASGVGAPQVSIPNFHVGGFMLDVAGLPDGDEHKDLPSIPGLIIIPGDVGFLHAFFSALLVVQNVAPDGSGLTVSSLRAKINLPPGPDGVRGSGDDPLRIARTAQGGAQDTLPIRRVVTSAGFGSGPSSDDFLMPQEKGQAEFLLEGLKEGLASFDIDITGKLTVPSRGQTYDLKGKAAGAVLVRNPTFNITLAHPETVREGERYSLFATVVNTSSVDANLFRMELSERSLVGTRLVQGTPSRFSLDVLKAGASETFEMRFESRTTGRVKSGFLQSDDGLTGSFILKTGVGETGINLSSDTLLLPDFLVGTIPDPPPLKLDFMRILGLDWSLATVPQSGLAAGQARPSRDGVYNRASAFAAMGFRIRLGEGVPRALADFSFDYLETEIGRLDSEFTPTNVAAIYGVPLADARRILVTDRAQAQADDLACDAQRRRARQGRFFLRDVGAILENEVRAGRLRDALDAQALLASASSGRAPYLCAAIGRGGAGVPARILVTDRDGRRLGAVGPADPVDPDGSDGRVYEIPTGGVMPLLDAPGSHAEMALLATTSGTAYTVEVQGEGTGMADLGIVLGSQGGLERTAFMSVPLAAGSRARVRVVAGSPLAPTLEVDLSGRGATLERRVAPAPAFEPEPPPGVVVAQQWGKGDAPGQWVSFEKGDPLGRLVIVLFDKRIDRTTAQNVSSYAIPGDEVVAAALQPDRRTVFLMLRTPLSPLPPQKWITVGGVTDLDGDAIAPVTLPIRPDPETGIGGDLAGTIRRARGEAVAGATIVLNQPIQTDFGPGYVPIMTTRTAADGTYAIDWVLASGYGPARVDAYDLAAGERSSLYVTPYRMGQHMRGDLLIRGFGSVSGRVVDAQGLPVGSAYDASGVRTRSVIVNVNSSSRETTGAYANPDGTFLVKHVPVGTVVVTASDSRTASVGVAQVRVQSTDDVARTTVVLFSARGSVTGRVLRAGGVNPAVGLPVVVHANAPRTVGPEGVSLEEMDVGLAYTDATGAFTIGNVPAGAFRVRTFDPVTYEEAKASGFVANGTTATATLVLPGSGATIRGIVTNDLGAPEPYARVAGGPGQTVTAVDGTFVLANFPLGKFKIGAQARNRPAFGEASLDLLSPNDIQDVVIRLRPLGSIVGLVHEADGQTPVSGEPVLLMTAGGVLYRTRTNGLGQFRFDNVPAYDLGDPTKPGVFRVQSVNYHAHERGAYYDGGEALTRLSFGGQVASVDVVYRGRGPVRGRLVLKNGNPALGDVLLTVTEVIVTTGDQQGGIAGEVQADEAALAGALITGLGSVLDDYGVGLPGEAADFLASQKSSEKKIHVFFARNDILMRSVGLGPQGWVDGRFSVDSVLGGPIKLAAKTTFSGTVGRTAEMPRTTDLTQRFVDFGDIVLEPSTGKIAGRVFMPDGVTPVGAGVQVAIAGTPPIALQTSADGTFQFLGVPVGDFTLVADTGTPALGTAASSTAQIRTNAFQDRAGKRLLNVRLLGSTKGTLPPGVSVTADVRLEGAGGVRVLVNDADGTPAQGAIVTLATSSTLAAPVAAGFVDQATDRNGVVELLPVPEGGFAVNARSLRAGELPGYVSGMIPKTPQDGLRRDVTIVLGQNAAADGTTTAIQGIGTVTGTITEPSGATFTGIASVAVAAHGATLYTSVTGTGRYQVYPVPTGAVHVSILDVDRNRGASADGILLADGGSVAVDVALGIEGRLSGRVTSFDGASVVPAAAVRLTTPAGVRLVTAADAGGRYSLAGVPLGPFDIVAEEPITEIQGLVHGRVAPPVEAQELDIRLAPVGNVAGTVYVGGTRLDAGGQPTDAQGRRVSAAGAPFIQLHLEGIGTGRSITSFSDGSFTFRTLAAGSYRLGATHQTLPDGGERLVVVTENGSTVDGSLALAGTGRARGTVKDSVTGAGVPSVSLTLNSRSPYTVGTLTRLSGPDGSFSFEPVPSGAFSISAVTTIGNPPLGTNADGVVSANAVADFNDGALGALRLEPVGSIAGCVLDGATPSFRAVVTLHGARADIAKRCARDGTFRFDSLPVGTYSLEATDPSGARVRAQAAVAQNATTELGDLILDRSRPSVQATSPQDGASAVPLDAVVQVIFSQAIDPATLDATTLLVRIAGQPVAGQIQVGADRRSATFTPAEPFPSLAQVRVDVIADVLNFDGTVRTPGIRTVNGFSMTAPFTLSFLTADRTPPRVTALSPADGSVDVALDSVVRITFSKPMDPRSLAGMALVRNGSQRVPGTANAAPSFGSTVFIFTPSQLLEPDSRYALSIPGPIMDTWGNVLPGSSFGAQFRSRDTVGPVLTALRFQGRAFRGQPLALSVVADDPSAVRSVDYFVNGTLAGTATQPPFGLTARLDPALPSTVTIAAIATGFSGVRGVPFVISAPVSTASPPAVAIRPLGQTVVSPGESIRFSADASGDIGVQSLRLLVQGILGAVETVNLTVPVPVTSASLAFMVPPTLASGTVLTLRATATDAGGQSREANPLALSIRNTAGPVATIISPAQGASFGPAADVSLLVQATHADGVAALAFEVDQGASVLVPRTTATVAGVPSLAAQTFTFRTPVPFTSGLIVRAFATDVHGTTSEAPSISLAAAGMPAPPTATLSFPSGNRFEPGTTATADVDVAASNAITEEDFLVNGALAEARTITAAAGSAPTQHFRFAIPRSSALGTTFRIGARAIDSAGNRSPLAEDTVTVADLTPPLVATPSISGSLAPGTDVTVLAAASDNFALSAISYSVDGAVTGGGTFLVAPPTANAQAAFRFTIPFTALPGAAFTVRVRAQDTSGNQSPDSLVASAVAGVTPTLGTVAGTVTDPSGAAVVGARVTITASNGTFVTATASGGRYSLSAVGLGAVSAVAQDPATGLRGRASGNFVQSTSLALDIALDATGTVQGTLTRADGTAAAGVSVAIDRTLTSGLPSNATTTALGGFRFDYVPAGAFTLDARDAATGDRGRVSGTLARAAQTSTVNFALNGLGTLNVRVTNGQGAAIQSAQVVATSTTVFGGSRTLLTDATGLASFTSWLAGGFSVTVTDPSGRLTGSASGTLVAGATQAVAVQLRSLGSLTGVVFAPDGTPPVGGATVSLSGTSVSTTLTSSTGAFRFDAVLSGSYSLSATDAAGIERARASGITISQGLVTTQNLTFVGLGTVSGTVRPPSGSASGFAVSVVSANTPFGRTFTTTTDAQGRYQVASVPVGAFTASVRDAVRQLAGSASGQIARDGDTAQADIQLSTTATVGTVSGTVTDPNGAAVPGARVTLSYTTSGGAFSLVATTSSTGRYSLSGVSLSATISALAEDLTRALRGRASGSFASQSTALTLDIALDATGTVQGTLTRSDGTTPASGVGVTINRTLTSGLPSSVTTSAQGGFRFDYVPIGAFTLDAVLASTGDRARASSQLRTFGEVRTVDFSLTGQGTVQVSVTNATGSAVQGAQVSLSSALSTGLGSTRTLATDASGLASFTGTLAGSFSVSVTDPASGLSTSASGTLASGAVVAVAVRLQPVGSIAGIVLAPDGTTTVSGATVALSGASYATTVTAGTGAFRFDRLPLSSSYALTGSDSSGRRRAREINVALTQSGALVTRNLTFVGMGTVTGTARDASGPAAGLYVLLQSANAAFGGYLTATTDAQGRYRVDGVPVGAFTASAQDSVRQLGGSASGQIVRDGDLVLADLSLLNDAVTLPRSSNHDANGFNHDVQPDGSTQGQGVTALRSAFLLDVVQSGAPSRFTGASLGSSEIDRRGIALSRRGLAGIDVTRKVFVPRDGYFERRLELLTNATAQPVTLTVRLTSTVAAASPSSPEALIATSSGGASLSVSGPSPDRWAVTSANGGSDPDPFIQLSTQPPAAFVFDGPGAAERVGGASFSQTAQGDGVLVLEWRNVTIMPGATAGYMHFAAQQVSRTAATASATRLVSLPPEALVGLTPADIAAIRNFAVPSSGLSSVPPLAPLAGAVDGRVLAGDGNTPIQNAIVTFKSGNIYYSRARRFVGGGAAQSDAQGLFHFAGAFDDVGGSLPVPTDAPFTLTTTHPQTGVSAQATGSFTGTHAQQDLVFSGTGLIAGRVLRHTGALVTSGAVRTIVNRAYLDVSVSSAGAYSMTGLAPGTYPLTAMTGIAGAGQLQGTASATVVSGATATADVTIQPTGSVSVSVRNAAGGASASTVVTVSNPSGFTVSYYTDASGSALIPDVPASTVTVRATDPVAGAVTQAQVAVVQDQTATVALAFGGSGTASVTVQFASGAPAANVLVTVTDSGGGAGRTAYTDSAGLATIPNVAAGAFTASAAHPSLASQIGRAAGTMSGGATVAVTVRLPAVATLEVHLSFALAGAVVYLSDGASGGAFNRSDLTDASGTVTFTAVPEGRLAVYATYSSGFGGTAFFGSTVGAIAPQQDGQTVALTIPYPIAGRVAGTIYAGDGRTRIQSAFVQITDSLSGLGAASATNTDANGRYRFFPVSSGPQGFTVRATYGGATVTGTGVVVARNVTVTVDLVLPVAVVSGHVTYSDGAPVPSPTVQLTRGGVIYYGTSTSTGAYVVTGFGVGTGVLSANDPATGLNTTVSATVSSATAPLALDVVLPPSGTVTGTVRDAGGGAVASARVSLRTTGLSLERSLTADARGVYTAAHVALGQLSVLSWNATTSGFASGSLLADRGTAQIDVAFTPTASLSGSVLEQNGATYTSSVSGSVPRVTIRSLVYRGPYGFSSQTVYGNSRGAYAAPSVPVGPVEIIADDDYDPTHVPGIAETSVAAGGSTVNVSMGSALAFPYRLDGADLFRYTVTDSGQLGACGTTDGRIQSYSHAENLTVDGLPNAYSPAGIAAGARTVSLVPDSMSGLTLTRRVFSPAAGGFARYLEVFTNPGSTPITANVGIESLALSDASTRIVVAPAQTANAYAVLDDLYGGGTATYPALAEVFGGTGRAAGTLAPTATTFTQASGAYSISWSLTVPAGATRILMHFAVQRNPGDSVGARAQAASLADLTDPNALSGMSTAERAAVVNFRP